MNSETMWQAVTTRDSAADGRFFYLSLIHI